MARRRGGGRRGGGRRGGGRRGGSQLGLLARRAREPGRRARRVGAQGGGGGAAGGGPHGGGRRGSGHAEVGGKPRVAAADPVNEGVWVHAPGCDRDGGSLGGGECALELVAGYECVLEGGFRVGGGFGGGFGGGGLGGLGGGDGGGGLFGGDGGRGDLGGEGFGFGGLGGLDESRGLGGGLLDGAAVTSDGAATRRPALLGVRGIGVDDVGGVRGGQVRIWGRYGGDMEEIWGGQVRIWLGCALQRAGRRLEG